MNYIVSKLKDKIQALKQTGNGEPFPAVGWDFFKGDLDDEWVICFVYNNSVNSLLFINSFLIPKRITPSTCNEELFKADNSIVAGWSILGNDTLDSPLSGRTPPLDQCEPLYFNRFFQGFPRGSENYFEINQKLTTTLGLHFCPEKGAFCSLDALGDLVPQILLKRSDDLSYILLKRDALDKFLSITDCNLIRCFEYRKIDDDINYRGVENKHTKSTSNPIFCFRSCYFKNNGIIKGLDRRGYNILTQNKSYRQIEQEAYEGENGKYPIEFIIQDIKAGRTVKTDLTQDNLSSYFDLGSQKPLETSPVFFKPDVLNKYKNDPDKYEMTERTITCRGGWHLQTFDVNEQGQVHTMAIYLTYLPFEELCHWRSYNEAPKGKISKRSFDTDFLGQFSSQPEPISELKKALDQLWRLTIQPENQPLWVPHKNSMEQTFHGFYYLLTENYNDWQSFVQDLCRIVIEGFAFQTIKQISMRFGCYDSELRSIKLLRKCLKKIGVDGDELSEIFDPLTELNEARGKTKAHRGDKPVTLQYKDDAMDKINKVTNSINRLLMIVTAGKLNEQPK